METETKTKTKMESKQRMRLRLRLDYRVAAIVGIVMIGVLTAGVWLALIVGIGKPRFPSPTVTPSPPDRVWDKTIKAQKRTLLLEENGEGLSVGDLLRFARSEELKPKLKAIALLGQRRERSAVPLLKRLVEFDERMEARATALQALMRIGDDEAADAYLLALQRGGLEGRLAELALQKVEREDVWQEVLNLYLNTGERLTQEGALSVLKQINPAGLRPLCRLLGKLPTHSHPSSSSFEAEGTLRKVERIERVLSLLRNLSDCATKLVWLAEKDPDPAVRNGAVCLLMRFPCPQAVPVLVKALESKDVRLKVQAAAALSAVPTPAAKPALMRAVRDPNPAVASAAASALAALGGAPSPEVKRLLKHPAPSVRFSAVCDLAADRSSEAITLLKEKLRDPDARVRGMSARVLAAKGEAGVCVLLQSLRGADSNWRAQVLSCLGRTNNRAALQALKDGLSSSNDAVRTAAQVALVQTGEPALWIFQQALNSSNPKVRESAVMGLASIATERALRLLLPIAAAEKDEGVRIRAVEAIGQRGFSEAIPPLKRALYVSLANGTRPPAPQRGGEGRIAEAAALSLGRIGSQGVEVLKEALRSNNEQARVAAAHALSIFGDTEAAKILSQMAQMAQTAQTAQSQQDLTYLIRSLQALARAGDRKALQQLIQMMGSDNPKTQLYAKAALIGVRNAAVFALISALHDPNPRIRAGSAYVLGVIRAEVARDELVKLTSDKDASVRQAAEYALRILQE